MCWLFSAIACLSYRHNQSISIVNIDSWLSKSVSINCVQKLFIFFEVFSSYFSRSSNQLSIAAYTNSSYTWNNEK